MVPNLAFLSKLGTTLRHHPFTVVFHPFIVIASLAALGLTSLPGLAQQTPTSPAGSASQPKPASQPKATSNNAAKQPAPIPEPPARVWLIAPFADGPWTLRIDNEGTRPMRIAADVRLLQLEIRTGAKNKKPIRCTAPAGLKPKNFPEKRALLLPPEHSYTETFDPHLLCFGKDAAALAGGGVVSSWWGFSPPPKWSRKPPDPPFVVDTTDDPPTFASARGLKAPTLVLSYDSYAASASQHLKSESEADRGSAQSGANKDSAQSDANKSSSDSKGVSSATSSTDNQNPSAPGNSNTTEGSNPSSTPIVDANAARLEVTADPYSDATNPRQITIRLKAQNVGKRPMMVALRSRMFEFSIQGPGGTVVCGLDQNKQAIPRDLYQTLKPGASTSFAILLKEVCPDNAFKREGLYHVSATLHATESGSEYELDGYTAVVQSKNATLVRLQNASEPFYVDPPKAVLTKTLEDAKRE